jgi:DNA-directed RNA polymerase specialized sigma24 family protein
VGRDERDEKVAWLIKHGWTYRRIAARLGCSVGTVQKSVYRNRRRQEGQPRTREIGAIPSVTGQRPVKAGHSRA